MKLPIYRLVQIVDGRLFAEDFDPEAGFDHKEGFKLRGFSCKSVHRNERTRAELQGQLCFHELAGPMWDGEKDGRPVIRYESREANAKLSA